MAKGRIKHLNLDKGYGFIELKSSDRDVFFHKSKLRGFQFNMLEKGMVVEYEWEKGSRGPQAVFVRVPDSTHDKNRQTHEYRFLNPYNFVRYLEVCYPEKRRPSNDVLGDCPPPPHDRYMGLTGRITCKVEAKTHLFISDSHNIQDIQLDNKKKHKIYRFFQYNGQPALPASSLRGMIRSLFETVTNSCFAEFETDEPYPLEYRLSHAPDLIYLIRDKGKEMLRPVAMPRIRYTYRRQDYITDNLSYCEKYSQLCPACRVFGWVHKGGKSNDLQEPVAYAGRVRFSHGEIKESKGTERELTLAILSSPKPTATEFYLLNSESKPDPQINYNDENAKLRGRKFYHHNVQATEYATDQKSDQNRTVRHALKPGAIFAFEIDFENLNQLELGALIYALELEEGMYHRLGYAKPLGFGSIKISIEIIEKFDWEERLTSVAPKAGWSTVNKDKILESKQEFLNAMRNIYGEEQFTNLQLELKAILGKQNLPIHYPRPTSQLDPNKPSFEWFVGNKKRRGKSPGPVALPVATEIQKGLPLIDKDGRPGR